MNPFQQPDQPFPADATDRAGQPLTLGTQVQTRLGRRRVTGEVVGWRAPDRIRVLTHTLHLHTVPIGAVEVNPGPNID